MPSRLTPFASSHRLVAAIRISPTANFAVDLGLSRSCFIVLTGGVAMRRALRRAANHWRNCIKAPYSH
ncbi:hypothetical protein TgHK011_009353 [Trichoderma gracile]|nr:hypothetical protein TgHK011_009353 [Trichoderma gracile]